MTAVEFKDGSTKEFVFCAVGDLNSVGLRSPGRSRGWQLESEVDFQAGLGSFDDMATTFIGIVGVTFFRCIKRCR